MNDIRDVTESPLGQYQKRKGVYPKAVDGTFRRLKWLIMIIALGVYYVTPWLRWNRGPYAPDQAILIDLAHRRFFMFGIEIWPHEFYYIAGLLIMAGIGLFLLTSAVGRAWCGYACPQTVWTDLFQHVERWIDGDRNAQIRLANAAWGPAKAARRLAKWSVWLAIAMATGGAWIFYFADAPTLAAQLFSGTAPYVAYFTIFILTMTTFIFGGFMREQVCIYMCPWPRIQTAMLDEQSLIVTYKEGRGEPRASVKKAEAHPGDFGDCIDCNQCVAVCPTGIDIREGAQIGCITCALCIDACDKVMAQVGRPRGLIDYATLADAELEKQGKPAAPVLKTLLRPRTLIYFGVWSSIGLALLFVLGNRTRIDISAQQERNPIYVQLSNGDVRDSYTVRLRNMESRPRVMEISLAGLPGGRMWRSETTEKQAGASLRLTVAPDSVQKLNILVVAPYEGPQRDDFTLSVKAMDAQGGHDSHDVVFERPGSE